jgi:hypothetical protein
VYGVVYCSVQNRAKKKNVGVNMNMNERRIIECYCVIMYVIVYCICAMCYMI